MERSCQFAFLFLNLFINALWCWQFLSKLKTVAYPGTQTSPCSTKQANTYSFAIVDLWNSFIVIVVASGTSTRLALQYITSQETSSPQTTLNTRPNFLHRGTSPLSWSRLLDVNSHTVNEDAVDLFDTLPYFTPKAGEPNNMLCLNDR